MLFALCKLFFQNNLIEFDSNTPQDVISLSKEITRPQGLPRQIQSKLEKIIPYQDHITAIDRRGLIDKLKSIKSSKTISIALKIILGSASTTEKSTRISLMLQDENQSLVGLWNAVQDLNSAAGTRTGFDEFLVRALSWLYSFTSWEDRLECISSIIRQSENGIAELTDYVALLEQTQLLVSPEVYRTLADRWEETNRSTFEDIFSLFQRYDELTDIEVSPILQILSQIDPGIRRSTVLTHIESLHMKCRTKESSVLDTLKEIPKDRIEEVLKFSALLHQDYPKIEPRIIIVTVSSLTPSLKKDMLILSKKWEKSEIIPGFTIIDYLWFLHIMYPEISSLKAHIACFKNDQIQLKSILSTNQTLSRLFSQRTSLLSSVLSREESKLLSFQLNKWDKMSTGLRRQLAKKNLYFAEMALENSLQNFVDPLFRTRNGRELLKDRSQEIVNYYPHLRSWLIETFPPEKHMEYYPPVQIKRKSQELDITCTFHHPTKRPRETLDSLGANMVPLPNSLFVQYIDQAGIDEGGPGRDFLSTLFHQLVEEGIIRHGIPQWKLNVEEQEQKQFLQSIGKLIGFILYSEHAYQIGQVFHENFFKALFYWLSRMDTNGMLGLDAKIHTLGLLWEDTILDPYESKLMPFLKAQSTKEIASTSEVIREWHEALFETVPRKYLNKKRELVPGKIQKDLRTLKQKLLPEHLLKPIENIAVGFAEVSERWVNLKNFDVLAFTFLVQGTLDREVLKNSFFFSRKVNKAYQKWLFDWIENTTTENLKGFLNYLTGSPTLPGNLKITFSCSCDCKGIIPSTCFGTVELPMTMTKDEFLLELEKFEEGSREGFGVG